MIYLGSKNGKKQIFQSKTHPSQENYPEFSGVTGPFRTVRGAKAMLHYGDNNPHLLSVSDAERIGKLYQEDLNNKRSSTMSPQITLTGTMKNNAILSGTGLKLHKGQAVQLHFTTNLPNTFDFFASPIDNSWGEDSIHINKEEVELDNVLITLWNAEDPYRECTFDGTHFVWVTNTNRKYERDDPRIRSIKSITRKS